MASATDVANFFVDITKNTDDPMTNLRLQKYLYFAQGWSLVRLNKPLFSDKIESGQLGPVVSEVYNDFSSHGKDQIRNPRDSYSPSIFEDEEMELLMDVALNYQRYSTYGLVDLCHENGSAWSSTYDDSAPNMEIPLELIREEFSKKVELPRFDMDSAIKKMKKIGYRDSEGRLVLPKELDDD
jgi:uncharacterized phage-associated protein